MLIIGVYTFFLAHLMLHWQLNTLLLWAQSVAKVGSFRNTHQNLGYNLGYIPIGVLGVSILPCL